MKNLKALIEKRNGLVASLRKITDAAAAETRALSEDEASEFDRVTEEVRALDETIDRLRALPDDVTPEPTPEPGADPGSEPETRDGMDMGEVRAFAAYIRSTVETRAATNLTMTDNGAIVPKTIAAQIVKQVRDRAPIYEAATKYNVRGNLSIPYYDEGTDHVTVAWATEFTDLESHSGKFTTVDLSGYLAGALTKVSRSLLNSQDFDLVSFVVSDMAQKIAEFIESEIISGTRVGGLSGVKQTVTAASATAVTTDELIDLQDSVKDVYQAGAMWVMSPKTRTAIRKLKDNEGRYLLQDDLNSPFGKVLLGKPVYVSDSMPDMAAGKNAIFYGDFSGLAVKMVEEPAIQILQEHYATQHAIGVVGWLEFDAKVQDAQKLAKLTMKAGA